MKTLIILDKSGSIGLRYALVEGDVSRFNGLVLNKETEIEKECIDYLMKGMASNAITFTDDITTYSGIKYKTALMVYYAEKNSVEFTIKITTTTSPLSEPVLTLELK